MAEVTLSQLPGEATEATIQAWYFEEGDAVVKGDEIVELLTEEGNVTVTAPISGILAEVYYDEGESVGAGEVLCLIEKEDLDVKETKKGRKGQDDEDGDKDKEEEE